MTLEHLIASATRPGIYVDASYCAKGDLSIISIVRHFEGGVSVEIRFIKCLSSGDAEMEAIKFAAAHWPGQPIYSDCEGAVNICKGRGLNVHKIKRRFNKAADHFCYIGKRLLIKDDLSRH